MCGGRTALHHQQPDDAYDPASAGKTSITVTASGGEASNPDAGSAHGGSPIDSGLSGGASGAAGEPNDVVGDQAVSDPISFPVWPTSPVTSLASHFYSPSLALACSDANCLVFWAKKKGAHFARVTFDGVWLDPNPGTYVGRVWDYSWQQTYPPIAVVSDGARYLLLWQQYNGAELRWVVRRLEARAGGWVDPEPIPISGFVSALPTPGGGTILRPSLPAALAWDGQHFLAVIPHQEQLHAVLLEQDRAALKVSSDLPLGSDADLSRVSVTSAMPGSFVVFWNNGSAAEPHARALLLRPSQGVLNAPTPWSLPKAPHHKNATLTSKAGQYLLTWQETGTSTLRAAIRDESADGSERPWQLATLPLQQAANFAFDGNAYVGVNDRGEIAELDPETLAVVPNVMRFEAGEVARIARTAKNATLIAHFTNANAVHVHTRSGKCRRSGVGTHGFVCGRAAARIVCDGWFSIPSRVDGREPALVQALCSRQKRTRCLTVDRC